MVHPQRRQARQHPAEPVFGFEEQFPLGRPTGAANNTDAPSEEGVRAWGLRGMGALPNKTDQPLPAWRYDHERQIAVDLDGVGINELRMDPSADSVSNNDGDEGPNEDWVHDFMPDTPVQPV